ncbi:hypothetical protein [Haloarcula salinisoli]|uniref:Uncharacterized protein n=1 Tax=Haloarcula salinisoli TaxID=2487746 RepID=A0A8J7YMF8_9EURY|nr:hypothetical protein [Halomicroarcula salinisoli]MBX0305971.1 hypothetical protein [Halomicroarcula salinisoli]
MERRRLVATLALLALVALAGCATVPSPGTVCSGCTEMPEQTDNVSVDDSVTHFYVESEGDARVEARMQLSGSGVDSLRTDRGKLQALVGRIKEGYGPSAFERRNLTGRMDGDTLVVTYRVSDVGERRFDTVVVDAFYRYDGDGPETEDNYEQSFYIGTDRLVVHGPDGTRSLVDPPDGTSDGDRVTWTGDEVSPRTYVVFGSHEALARPAIALEVLSWAVGSAVPGALLLGVPLVGLASAFAVYYPRRLDDGWNPREDWVLRAQLALGGLLVAHFLFLAMLGNLGGLFTLGLLALVIWRYRPGEGIFPRVRGVAESVPGALLSPEITDERLTAVAVAIVFAALTAVVVVDYRGTVTFWVFLVTSGNILVTFPVLGLLVSKPRLSVARTALVTALAGTVWLSILAGVVDSGALGGGGLLWGLLLLSFIFLPSPLFYGTLWLTAE